MRTSYEDRATLVSKSQHGYRRETKQYPSNHDGGCNTHKPQVQTYTGTRVKGVALLHKQAYTPVTNDSHCKTDPKKQ